MTLTNRILLQAFIPLLVLLAVIGGLSVYYTQDMRAKQDFVIHTYRVIRTAETLLTDAVDAETGQRGYLLTGQKPYLAPYQGALARIDNHLAQLKQLTEDNPRQQARIARLEELLHRRIDLLTQAIEIRDRGGEDAVASFILSGSGKAAMDQIRQVIAPACPLCSKPLLDSDITSAVRALIQILQQPVTK